MRIEQPPMRPMDLDPSFVPYLDSVIATRTRPINEDNIVERRQRMAALRSTNATAPPDDIEIATHQMQCCNHVVAVRVYRPRAALSNMPCIAYFHGGGWMYGSAEQSDPTAIRYCREVQAVVVSPDYRLSPEHPFPAGFEDCWQTLQWVVACSKDIGVDCARLAVAGESSGANLAAACALAARDAKLALALQVLLYPALGIDFETSSYRDNAHAPVLSRSEMMYFWDHYLSNDRCTTDPHAVPLAAVDLRALAPAWIATAEYDPLRDDGVHYAQRLKAADVEVHYQNATRLPHGFMRAWSVSQDVQIIAGQAVQAFRDRFNSI